MSKGLYIHVPFCKYICSYCDFSKKYIKNQPVLEYVKAVSQELEMYMPFTDVNTIYIGGGTPSSLSVSQFDLLFKKLNQLIDFSKIEEFTVELNPDDVTEQYLIFLKNNNVNRISIGVQSLNNSILSTVNRNHSFEDVETALCLAQKHFTNVNLDFMFNLPNQTKKDIDLSLDFITKYKPSHISYYGLIFEEHTILATQKNSYWSEDFEGEIYSYIQSGLSQLGYQQYEISNYSLPGYESKHNIHYWNGDQYYAAGLGSSGFLDGKRFTNTSSLKEYITKVNAGVMPIVEEEKIGLEDEKLEKIMLGLRYYQYIDLGYNIINYIKSNETLKSKFDYKGEKVRLKREFYYISNAIILDILERV